MILANPNNWFPWVDQVDRPYFIAIDKYDKVYAEFTNFDMAHPVTASQNNWYEEIDKANLKLFIIKGRYGYYWVEMNTGLIYCTAQHEIGNKPVITYAIGLVIGKEAITGKQKDFKLKHFKVSDVELMNPGTKVIRGMNCHPDGKFDNKVALKEKKIPFDMSQTSEVFFGWELANEYGRLTFEGSVLNKRPGFYLHLLFTPLVDLKNTDVSVMMFDVQRQEERFKLCFEEHEKLAAGVKYNWRTKIL